MNGIEKITDRIRVEAEAECKAIADEANAKCEEIKASYDQQAQEEYWRIIKKGARDAEMHVEHLGSVAQLEAKKQVLATKQDMVARAFNRAIELISSLPENQYVPFLARLAAEASVTGDEQIIMAASDRTHYGKQVCIKANELLSSKGKTASLTLSDQTRDIRGGLILSSGNIEVNCSTDKLVLQHKSNLAAQVAEVLFD